METQYPFENTFKYTVEAEKAFTFKVRIPSFAQHVKENGVSADDSAGPVTELSFAIASGERKELVISFDTVPYMEDRPHDLKCVKCGSLVFSVPIRYEKKMLEYERDGVERKFPYCDYEYVMQSAWNYAYCGTALQVERREVGRIPFSSQQPPVVIKAEGKPIRWGLEDGYDTVCAKVPESGEVIGEKEELFLYPYGCAKLRMTELPLCAAVP